VKYIICGPGQDSRPHLIYPESDQEVPMKFAWRPEGPAWKRADTLRRKGFSQAELRKVESGDETRTAEAAGHLLLALRWYSLAISYRHRGSEDQSPD
jgi:hypothetical protein